MTPPTLSRDLLVVVPCLNEADHLDEVLRTLVEGRDADRQTIVVVDGGSTDGSREIVQRWATNTPALVLLDNPAKLQSAGVNAAVAAFGRDASTLVRVDAHATYPADYVARLEAIARETGADSVVVPMATSGAGCFRTAASMAQNSKLGTGGAAHRSGGKSDWVDHGHHALMTIERFRSLGGYDPRFSHNEDAEYDTRLRKAGGRVWMAGDLVVGYVPRGTVRTLFRQYFNYGRGRARTVRLHGERLKPRQAAPLLVAPAVVIAPVALLSGLWPGFALALVPALVWAAACLGGGLVLARRGPWPCAGLMGVAAMIMHLGWSLGFWRECLRKPLAPRTDGL